MSLFRFAAVTVSLFALSAPALAQSGATAVTREQLPSLIKEAIMNDPEMIMQALEKLRMKKAEDAKRAGAEALAKNKDSIINNPDLPSAGASAKDADITIVEFFDYHCGYCKHFLPELTKLLAEDKKVRVLFVDFPILSEDSATAARAAIAVNRFDKKKYFEFHAALMKSNAKYDEAKILEIANSVGIKPATLKAEMNKPEVAAILNKNRNMARDLNISGTPAVIIGNQLIPGAMQYEELKKTVEEERKAAKK